ncbi:MAG: type II toxin-antitoxin system VapC family toxin [Desulfomicrobium sp.]|nr:type II toxin-antitoxin system VapC family toxin [Pseudomonadota bacterium]MBV1711717.1 type II toxin-antitoxin system VapC family toxin [Desulfomicrobium sp.]MBU4572695.1 type II toxin-antitoxin system VapC family toxin [Pseudomonadota bacterium]MBU4593524.1 type II toxin-antitoxin system VapC family toxin [Pseudomonadota bacterium]MBV1720446.1 type II toxin-antitoxin system VapC family toxin [Desulfomicrobium sp.]
MIIYLLDTNICIYVIKRRPPQVLERFRQAAVSSIGISSITFSELMYGSAKSLRPEQNRIALTQFVAPLEVVPYDDMAAQRYGDLRACLERQGTPIGSLDMLIAAHALALNCVLVTNNVKEFARVPQLRMENWAME